MNIIKNRYLYFLISLLVIIPGLIFMIINWVNLGTPIPLGIDFTGGSLLEVQFTGTRPTTEQIQDAFLKFAQNTDPTVQALGEDSYAIRSKTIDDATKGQIVAEFENLSGKPVNTLTFSSVSASVGAEVTRAAAIAILMAAVAILLYIWYAFRGVDHAFRYGTAALFLTALLTVIGFSVHDTIVVFDRIRENSHVYRRVAYEPLVNHSIVQTLDRSINTQLTVMFTLFALVLFGGDSIRHFVIILLVGIFSGTYSSIFNASPILVVWENQEWKNWFRRPATAQ